MALVEKKPAPNFEENTIDNGTDTDTGTADNGGDEQVTRNLSANERVAAATAAKAAKENAQASAGEQTQTASASTAVAVKSQGSLAAKMAASDPFKSMENALHVDYNTLTRLQVTNGNVKNKDDGKLMGDHVVLEIISIQKHHVMSPGGDKDDDESLQFLKYSDDGIHARDTGEPLTKYLEEAKKAGYDKARIVERLILVGMLESSANNKGPIGELVQIDLAPRSVANFNRHRVSTTFRIGRGLQKPEGSERVLIKADVQSKNGNDWTDALFEAAPAV